MKPLQEANNFAQAHRLLASFCFIVAAIAFLTAVFSISVRCGSSSPVSGLVVLFSSHVSITSLQATCQCRVIWCSEYDRRDAHALRQQLAHVSVQWVSILRALPFVGMTVLQHCRRTVSKTMLIQNCDFRITAYSGNGMSTT